jgi:glycosyltransferase involved in cell wall biosynthesis
MPQNSWASFCISTFKRPEILTIQLELISRQTFQEFEVIVSDNDPEGSARKVVDGMKDPRFKYFHNGENLGMIKSFNKSIERSTSPFVVMVTDDDPMEIEFLSVFRKVYEEFPEYSLYCGFLRNYSKEGEIEKLSNELFAQEVLDPTRTPNLLWSSCLMKKEDVISIGYIPDFGSPHLADHAFIIMVGSINGGIVLNKMFSKLSSHEMNFSKFNFDYYVLGCKGFYECLKTFFTEKGQFDRYEKMILKHLKKWFISNMFNLRKYYSVVQPDESMVAKLDECASKILEYSFMYHCRRKYFFKKLIFQFKLGTGIMKANR